jgi:hypothetical protein
MPADRSEPKPFLSWCSVWLVLEWWPVFFLAVVAAGLGRWWNVPHWVWANGRDVVSKELWIACVGTLVAIGLMVIGCRLLISCNVARPTESSLSISKKLYGWSALASFGLMLLTILQLVAWYSEGWVPTFLIRSPNALDYRYFKSVDLRLQQVSNAIRDGSLVLPQEIAPLRSPVERDNSSSKVINSKQLVNELREYVLDWSEAEYARSNEITGQQASLGMLAMMVDPDPQQLDRYLQWKAQEESRLELSIRDAERQAENAKKEHESIALQWAQETVPEKKSLLANQVVSAEDRLNGHVREQLRLQGRLDVLANEQLDQRGLNRQYPWLRLPTVSRGGWLRIACTWLLAMYLCVRLLGTGILSVASYLRKSRVTADRDDCSLNDFGWFLITAGLWWLGLGW